MKAVISLSGGLDSTCLLMYLLANGYDEIRAFSFNYGQKHDVELRKVQNNIKFLQDKGFNISHQIIDLRDCFSDSASSLHKGGEAIPEGHYAEENMKSTVVENRNIIFSSIIYGKALGWANKTQDNVVITLGLHAGDHCFTADTTIFTPNGYKTVGELKVGDDVYSFDGENLKTEITKLQDIIHKGTNSTIYEITTSAGKIKLTSEHKVYVCEIKITKNNSKFGFEKRFSSKLAKDLKVGDKLITPFLQTSTGEDADATIDGLVKFGESALTSISSIDVIEYDEPVDVYDLSVEKNHNFFAGDNGNILISNSIYPDCCEASQKMARELFAISNWGSERVDYIAPFVNIDKGMVLAGGIDAMKKMNFSDIEIETVLYNTHTCYNPSGEDGISCGKCGSCTERLEAFSFVGMKDPVPYAE
jgi:7-cyano-7-deazaguanine synthase in queuosine biosynthesis